MMMKAHSTPIAIPTRSERGLRKRDENPPSVSRTHCAIPGRREAPPRPGSGDLIRGEYPPNLLTINQTFVCTRAVRFHSTQQPTAIIYKNKTSPSGRAPDRKIYVTFFIV